MKLSLGGLGVAIQTMLPPKGGYNFIKANKSRWFKDAHASDVIRIIFWTIPSSWITYPHILIFIEVTDDRSAASKNTIYSHLMLFQICCKPPKN